MAALYIVLDISFHLWPEKALSGKVHGSGLPLEPCETMDTGEGLCFQTGRQNILEPLLEGADRGLHPGLSIDATACKVSGRLGLTCFSLIEVAVGHPDGKTLRMTGSSSWLPIAASLIGLTDQPLAH